LSNTATMGLDDIGLMNVSERASPECSVVIDIRRVEGANIGISGIGYGYGEIGSEP